MPNEINPSLPSGYKEVVTDVYTKYQAVLGVNAESIFNAVSDVCNQLKPADFNLGSLYSSFMGAVKNIVHKISTTIAKFAYDLADKLVNFFKSTGVTTENKQEALMSSVTSMADSSRNDIRINDYLGNYMMSGGIKESWCADTVRTLYTSLPGMDPSLEAEIKNFHSVENFRTWGKKKELYTETCTMKSDVRREYISAKVTPGDIMIQKRNGASHTGIVVEVYPDGYTDADTGREYPPGSFKTVEGNASDQLKYVIYTPDCKYLSGFIDMSGYLESDQFAAEAEPDTETEDKT